MKKRKYIGLWILLILVIALGGLAYWQRENIRIAMQGIKFTPEELEQQLTDNQERMQEVVESNTDITVRDLTEEEKAALKAGAQSREEIIERLTKPQTPQQTQAEQTKKPTSQELAEAAAREKYQKDLSALIAEVYVMQAEYNAAIEGMMEQAKQEYSAKSKSESSKSALLKWARGYISRATSLEKECDAKMDDITEKILVLLKENDGDLSLADEVVYAYANEKSLKKSWYLSEMKKRGLLE